MIKEKKLSKKENRNKKILNVVKNSIINFTLVVLSFSLCFFCIEIVLNKVLHYQKKEIAWGLDNSESFFSFDRQRIYSINPSIYYDEYFASDELGFRFNPLHKNKSAKKTIIMAGDSFTWGHGVKHMETYPALLEKKMLDKGHDVIIHNAGVQGYGLDQEFIYIKNCLTNYRPDILVWNIHVVDIGDSNSSCLFKEKNNSFKQIPAWMNILGFQGLILKYSPEFIKESSLLNIALRAPSIIKKQESYTFGCTKDFDFPDNNLSLAEMEKIKFFIKEVKNLAQETNTKIVLNLVPFQIYFDDENDYREELEAYWILQNTLSHSNVIFIDSNYNIARFLKSALADKRLNENHKTANSTTNINILGKSTENLAQALFFEEPEFAWGQRHLNLLGNQLLADTFFLELQYLFKN